jgi:hypothetical protein
MSDVVVRKRVASALLAVGLLGTVATAQPARAADPALHPAPAAGSHHACTLSSSGKCIRGGQFCSVRQYGRSGWDAQGRRWVCKGSRSRPHWLKP